MMVVLSGEQMRALEKRAVEQGETYLGLMEQAGMGVFEVIRQRMTEPAPAVVLCGKGNNGGDGFVIARLLRQWGAPVSVVLVEGAPKTPGAQTMYQRLADFDIPIHPLDHQAYEQIEKAAVLVDAIYGIGFRGSIEEAMVPLIQRVNAASAVRFAVDLPSGLQCDSGAVQGVCIQAEETISFTTLKPVHVLYPSADFCGRTTVKQVGISPSLIESFPPRMIQTDEQLVRKALPKRSQSAHKGTFGTLLCVCGSKGMMGAAVMSTRSALRCGAGLVNVALPESLYPIAAGQLTEPVFTLLQESKQGTLSRQCGARLYRALEGATACLVGCGMGNQADTRELVLGLLKRAKVPLIVDADGINAICGNIDDIREAEAPIILTPHPGEMARLLGISTAQVQADRHAAAHGFAVKNQAITVLKGANTLVALPDGRVFVNRTGNPGMARGGSGDVLAGMIASFAAQGMEPAQAALCGVYLHGLAGDRSAAKYSQAAMLPTDIIGELPGIFLELE